MKATSLITLPLLMLAAPLAAQQAKPLPAASQPSIPAADRLAAAARLMETTYPANNRDAYFERLAQPLMDNLLQSITADPEFQKQLDSKPGAQALFDRFLDDVKHMAIANMRASMPETMAAMTKAYARQFSVAELDQMTQFFATPTGRAYLTQLPDVMGDPDVAAVQQKSMTASNAMAMARVQKLVLDMDELSRQKRTTDKGAQKNDATPVLVGSYRDDAIPYEEQRNLWTSADRKAVDTQEAEVAGAESRLADQRGRLDLLKYEARLRAGETLSADDQAMLSSLRASFGKK